MQGRKARLVGATMLALLSSLAFSNAAEDGICAIISDPAGFDYHTVTLHGTITDLKQPISGRGNPYTTFKLKDPSEKCGVTVYKRGHPTLNPGEQVRVEGVFEKEHHVPPNFSFKNEVVAEKVTPVGR